MEPALTLLLRALRGESPPAAEPVGAERWREVIQLAELHGVSVLLARHHPTVDWPESVRAALRAHTRDRVLRSLGWVYELNAVTGLLAEAGIPTLPLKGPILSWRLYQDFAMRVSNDLDLLIPRHQVPAACRVLDAAGYRSFFPLAGATGRAYLRNYHDYGLWSPRGALIELHWNWAQRRLAISAPEAEWWTESRTLCTPAGQFTVLSTHHELLFLCIHAAKHGWSQLDLIFDVVAFCSHDVIDWRRVTEEAAKLGVGRMLNVTLALAQQLGSSIASPFPLDTAARSIIDQVQRRWATPAKTAIARRLLLELGMRERVQDRLRILARTVLTTTPGDWAMVRLPDQWFALYGFVRLLRLSGIWRRHPSDIFEQSMRGSSKVTELPTDPNAPDRHALHDAAVAFQLPSQA